MMEEHELGGKLLAGVSRSFYLTLKALPGGLREPLSLGYLLARTADTIADTAQVSGELRKECLQEFDRLVQSISPDAAAESALHERLRQEFIPHQSDTNEASLLDRLPEIFRALHASSPRDAIHIRTVLALITRGQMLDLERFPADGDLHALNTPADLDDYTWLVAGCVGEFWTKLCADHAPDILSPEKSVETMTALGIRYGKGLQLVNILRDIGKDLAMGRCYFPLEDLQKHGLTPAQIKADPSPLLAVLPPWRTLCREHLTCGLEYLRGLKPGRLVYATALPLLLAVRTLALIEHATWPELAKGIKVSRTEVARIMFDAGLASMKTGGIPRLVEKYLSAR